MFQKLHPVRPPLLYISVLFFLAPYLPWINSLVNQYAAKGPVSCFKESPCLNPIPVPPPLVNRLGRFQTYCCSSSCSFPQRTPSKSYIYAPHRPHCPPPLRSFTVSFSPFLDSTKEPPAIFISSWFLLAPPLMKG